jgi:hypothetical protein
MALTPELFLGAPRGLLIGGLVAAVLGFSSGLWLMRRLWRGWFARGHAPLGFVRAFLALAFSLGCAAGAAVALGLYVALSGYHALLARTRIAEIQCMELGPQQLRLYLVPLGPKGERGPTETYELAGDEWTVGGEILRWRPWLKMMSLPPMYAVTRVEGRWRSASDANHHKATAFDRGGGESRAWLYLERHGTRGPLAWLIDGAHGQAVSQLPDRLSVYDLYVAPDGYVLTKRSL